MIIESISSTQILHQPGSVEPFDAWSVCAAISILSEDTEAEEDEGSSDDEDGTKDEFLGQIDELSKEYTVTVYYTKQVNECKEEVEAEDVVIEIPFCSPELVFKNRNIAKCYGDMTFVVPMQVSSSGYNLETKITIFLLRPIFFLIQHS